MVLPWSQLDKLKRQWLCTVYYIRQTEGKLPRPSYNQDLSVSNHWPSVSSCIKKQAILQQPCNHDLADIVITNEHAPMRVSAFIKSITYRSVVVATLSWMSGGIVSCKVWFSMYYAPYYCKSRKFNYETSCESYFTLTIPLKFPWI